MTAAIVPIHDFCQASRANFPIDYACNVAYSLKEYRFYP